jgi:hypothetical protein
MSYIALIALLVTSAPAVLLGIVWLVSGVETSIKEAIGR